MPTPSSGAISMNDMRSEITRATGSALGMDEIRTRYGGSGAISFSDLYDSEGFKGLIQFAEIIMWRQITSCLMGGRNFIIDRTNLTVKSRAKFIQKLKLHNYEIEAVVFPEVGSEALSKEEWKRRLDSRPGKTIPQEVLDQMVDSYEIPLMSEGFSKITVL